MPSTIAPFPPGAPTLTGETLSISRFLNSPALVDRALRTVTNQRFIGDVLLSGRVAPSGGAVLYEQNESIYADRDPFTDIQPLADYPLTTVGFGPGLIAAVKKYGIDAKVSLEAVSRERISPVNRALTKMGNTLVKFYDSVVLAAINAAPIPTQAAGATWTASTSILNDLLTAKATVVNQNQGYLPDTLVIDDFAYVKLMANKDVQTSMMRETPQNPIYTGQMGRIAGLDVMVSPNVPVTTAGYVLDRSVLGSIADEVPFSTFTWWNQENEFWRLRVKRVSVPFVQEPNACVKITGIQ